jgi:hypothetical protein
VFSPAALATFSDSGRKIRKGQEALVLLATQPSSDPVLGKMERETICIDLDVAQDYKG